MAACLTNSCGIRPGVAFGEQTDEDRLWIRPRTSAHRSTAHRGLRPPRWRYQALPNKTGSRLVQSGRIDGWAKCSRWLGLQTGEVVHKGVEAKHLTAMNLQTGEVVHQCRVEP